MGGAATVLHLSLEFEVGLRNVVELAPLLCIEPTPVVIPLAHMMESFGHPVEVVEQVLTGRAALHLAFVPSSVVGAQVSEGEFVVEARVMLDAYRATVEARLGGVLACTRLVAAEDAAQSGEWSVIRGPLATLAANVPEQAAVWFAQRDGGYFTVEKGRTGDSLRDRDYFPELLACRDVVGALVVSKSTVMRSRLTGWAFVMGKSYQQR